MAVAAPTLAGGQDALLFVSGNQIVAASHKPGSKCTRTQISREEFERRIATGTFRCN